MTGYQSFGKLLSMLVRPWQIFAAYGLIGCLLFLYSFTQVDLSLTLTGFSFWPTVQKAFQYVGYFQRPVSTGIYLSLIGGLFILYGVIIKIVREGKMTLQSLFGLAVLLFVCLVFSYPAFSYDFFNYMFTAKTVVMYHKNPYEVIPLQFMGFEPWLSFLHWTHLPSAYAPLWILLTIPPYILGFGYFIWILWNMKLMVGVFYLFTVWTIARLLEDRSQKDQATAVVLFACNPLILIESLVSGHNDIVMVGCAMVALWLLWIKKQPIASFFMYAISVAVKEMTIVLAPLYIYGRNRWLPCIFMGVSLIAFLVLFKREMLPWYGIWVIPFIAIVPNPIVLVPFLYGSSLGLLLYYVPFLYFGHWNDPVPVAKSVLTVVPIVLSILSTIVWAGYRLRKDSV